MSSDAGRFWDERARENALYFVDNRLDYHNSNAEAFWTGGDGVLDQMLDLVGMDVGRSDTVVDIGCGVGRMTRALAARCARVIGIDVSREMIARARELNPHLTNVEWLQGDGTSLAGVNDASVDGCFSHVVFQHIPDPRITLGYVREMGRVLRPGGWALFQVSSNPAVHQQRPSLGARVKALMGAAPRGQDAAAWRGSAVDVRSLESTLDEAGFDVDRLDGAGTQFTTVLARRTAI